MPAPKFAAFKTEEPHEFWIKGFGVPIIGIISHVEFFEREDDTVETFLTIINDKKEYRVNLKSISVVGQELDQAA